MPNIRRSFPGKSFVQPEEIEDDEDEEDDSSVEAGHQQDAAPRGGKQMHRIGGGAGGKYFRPPTGARPPSSEDESSSEEEDDEEVTQEQQVTTTMNRGGGKQLRPAGGKYLRPPTGQDSDDDDSDEKEEEELKDDAESDMDEEPVRVVAHRGGGKSLMRMPHPEEEELKDESDDSDDEEVQPQVHVARGGGKSLRIRPSEDDVEEEEEEKEEDDEQLQPQQPVRIVPRTGGKMLSMLRPPPGDADSDEDDDASEEDEEEEAPKLAQTVDPSAAGTVSAIGGKQLRPPVVSHTERGLAAPDASAVPPLAHGGGKQLRHPGPEPVSTTTKATNSSAPVTRGHTGGKQLRPNFQQDDSDEEKEEDQESETLANPPKPPSKELSAKPISGGKQLRAPRLDEDDDEDEDSSDDDDDEPKVESKSPSRNKEETGAPVPATGQSKTEATKTESKPKSTTKPKVAIGRSPGGGKQLRRQPPKDEDEDHMEESEDDDDDDDDDEPFGDDGDSDDDDESDYEEEAKNSKKKKSMPRKPSKAPARPKRAAASRKKIVVDQDEEIFGDDDISSDEDDGDEMELPDENNTEALIRDEEDRKYLDSLNEIERENILAERFEALKEKYDMKKAIREAKKTKAASGGQANDGKKRKNDANRTASKQAKNDALGTEGDEELARKLSGAGKRESIRDKDITGAKSKKQAALAALKKNRKAHKQATGDGSDSEEDFGDDSDEDDDEFEAPWRGNSEQQKDQSKESAAISQLDDGLDEADDAEEGRGEAKDGLGAPKDESEATLDEMKMVTIPRRRLARWCNEPFFKAAVLECYVRLFIGEDDTGEKVYRLCEIVDVNPGKAPYKFPVANKGDKPVTTSLTLRLKFGSSERDFPMSLVSDASPDEQDFQKYIGAQRNNRSEVLSKRRARRLRRVQDELVNNYTYTTEDIENSLRARQKQGKIAVGTLGTHQIKVSIALQAAKDVVKEAEKNFEQAKIKLMDAGDNEDVNALDKAVKECEQALAAAREVLREREADDRLLQQAAEDHKRKLKARSRDRNWAHVNQRAMQENQRVDRHAHKEKEAAAEAQGEAFNPYARRKVKPKVLWKVGKDKGEEDKEEVGEDKEQKAQEENKKREAEQQLLEAPPTLVQEGAEAGDSAHQFAIDEEALAKDSLASLLVGGRKAKKRRIRRGLSLDEYFERKRSGTL